MANVDSAVNGVLQLLEGLSPSSWTADQFEDFLMRIGDQCGQYLLAQQKHDQPSRTHTDKGDVQNADDDHHSTEGDDEEEDEITEKQAMEEVAVAMERVRQHILKKYPYGALEEPTRRPYEPSNAPEQPGTKRARTGESRADVATGFAHASASVAPVYAIDAYLYPEETIDALVSSGVVSREYCKACGSTDIGLAEFITHSFSMEQLLYLSTVLLPHLPEIAHDAAGDAQDVGCSTQTIVDVGSRLGVVLWSCYFSARAGLLPQARRVVGLELSARYCAVQRDLARRFCARPLALTADATSSNSTSADTAGAHFQLNVVESSCFEGNGAQALAAANVLILHNVFEYFCDSPKGHLMCWKQLRDLVSGCHGQLWITSPSLEESLGNFSLEEAQALFPDVLGSATPITSAREAGKAWIASFLTPVDVTHLAEAFVAAWSARGEEEEDDEEDAHGHHSHGSGGCCGENGCADKDCEGGSEDGGDETLEELRELIGNIFVYRVR